MFGNSRNRVWSLPIFIALAALAVLVAALPAVAADSPVRNLLVNADFARSYAAKASPEPYVRLMPALNKAAAMPCAWEVFPSRWPQGGPNVAGSVAPVEVDGKTALRITTGKGESMRIRQYVEVVPEAQYNCSIWVKGKGSIALGVEAQAPACGQRLGEQRVQATDNWTQLHVAAKPGYHRHVSGMIIDVSENCDVMVRGAEYTAAIPDGPLPETLVTSKIKSDADTLFYEDFDGKECNFELGKDCKLTDENGGRFGRGLEVKPTSGGAKARLKFGNLPETGTIEFWFKPVALMQATYDCNPATGIFCMTTGATYKQVHFSFAGINTEIRFGFAREQWDNRDSLAMTSQLGNNGWGFWQPGVWHHFAGSWDGQVVRVYIDGQLQGLRIQGGLKTEYSCEQRNAELPNGQALELVLPSAGVIDEIRISKSLRFGPFVPVGATNAPLKTEDKSVTDKAAAGGQHLETPDKDLNDARLKTISPVPQVQADYILQTAAAKPAWQGMKGLDVQKDYFGQGVDGLQVDGNQEWDLANTAYWKLTDVQPGKYYIGLWQDSGGKQWDWKPEDPRVTEYWPDKLLSCLYVNGFQVRFKSTSDPVQVKPGVWLIETQTGEPIELKPGDELAVRPQGGSNVFLRVALYRQTPVRGHGLTGQNFGRTFSCPRPFTQLRLGVKTTIEHAGEAGTQHDAKIKIVNPLPYTAKFVLDWKVADYYGKPLVQKSEELSLDAHQMKEITYSFTADGDARGYFIDAKTRPAESFKPPFARPVEMIELNDWSKLEFLPNLNSPMQVRAHERIDLRTGNTGSRRYYLLDSGPWDRAPLAGRRVPNEVPADLKWQPSYVPNNEWWPPKGQFGNWYRKKFKLPDWLKGETIMLEIERAYREGVVFLNGKRLDGAVRGCIALRADATSLLKLDGENELVVCQRGEIATMREDYIDRYDQDNWIENDGHREWPPNAEMFATALSGVWLRAMPAVRVVQTLVVPDVPNNKVLVLNRVQNVRHTACTVEIRYDVAQEGQAVAGVEFPPQLVTLKPGETAEVKSIGTVTSGKGLFGGLFGGKDKKKYLQPYTTANPALACLSTSVVEKGAVVDVEKKRFGYRSVSVRGDHLILNGQPITFLGTGPNISPALEEDGTTIARMPPPLDYIDEIGVFTYVPSNSTWPGTEWELINNEKYWQRDRQSGVEGAWLAGSHPACAGWDITNECYWYGCYAVGGEGQLKFGARLYSTVEEIRKQIWPDYWFFGDGNATLGGKLNYNSWHYMNHGYQVGYSDGGSMPRPGRNLREVAYYAPDSFYLSGAALEPQKDAVVKGTHPADDWHLGTATASTEEFWFTDQNNGVALAKSLGEQAAVSSNLQFYTGRGMWWGKLSISAYRDMGASVMGVYAHQFLALCMQAVTFDMPEQQIRYYSGAKLGRRVTIHDDEFAPGKVQFTWQLLDSGGNKVDGDSVRFTSGTSTLRRERVTFRCPRVTQRTTFTLDLALRKDGKLREHEQRTLEVWPAAQPTSAGLTVALWDPQGKTQAVLEKFGCKVKPIVAISPEAIGDSRVLVIGPESVMGNMPAEREAVKQFTENGGHVLVLPQTATGIIPGEPYLEPRLYASIGFVRGANHPVMRGLKDMDLAMWNSDHLIARGAYRTPNRGNFLPLVECFNMDRQANCVAWTPVFETYLGKGSVLAVQLPLIEKFDTEPMAAEMLGRVLDYLGKESYKHPQGSLAVWSEISDPLLTRLKDLRTEFSVVNQVSAANPVTLVEMNLKNFDAQTDTFRKYVQDGGTLLLHRVRPEQQKWLGDLLGKKVTVEAQLYRSWVDRAMLERHDGLAEGLNHIDFYWRPNVGTEGAISTYQVSGIATDPKGQVEYVVKVEGAADYLFPGGWIEVQVGKGKVVIDQLKWELPEKTNNDYGSPMRVASMLLSNLGIVQRLPSTNPTIPQNVTYEALDLSKLVNVGFRDDKAGDGIGWVDWGPEQDIRDFPTGDFNVGPVPYKVAKGDKNAIVLNVCADHVKSLSNCPESVEIPVSKKKVAGIVFVHTGGWSNGLKPFAWREVCYADGTKETIALNNTNFADWNYGHDQFPDEEGTTTWVQWRGACKNYPITRVYATAWINPHPEKEITKIVLTDAAQLVGDRRFIAHIAVTLALQGENAAEKPRDSKKSYALLQDALALRQAKKLPEACAKLEDALKADDQNVGAWVTLAEIHSTTDGVEAFTTLCKRWFAAMPRNYQAHNTLGKFLEAKGKLEDALAEYKKSLELEWNQPPAIEAKTRLEKQLGRH